MKNLWLSVAAFGFLAVACGKSEQPKDNPAPLPVTGFDVKKTFETSCAPCHGLKGKGDGETAKALLHKPANLMMDKVQKKSDDELAVIIKNGTDKGMPPWKNVLKDEEVEAMVKYIRELGKK